MGTERSGEGSQTVALSVTPSVQDDDRDFIVFHAIACRKGDWTSPVYEGKDGEAVVYTMQFEHHEQTSHSSYWHYKIERSHGRVVDPSKGQW